ncbi:MAG: hypothetical protein NVS3B24_17970 [Candidatus Dormibacteria bacterium]
MMIHMTQRRRKAFSATVPDWLLQEAGERYGNVSEFVERAMVTQMQLDRQLEALYTAAGNGDPVTGRRSMDEFEASPGYPELAAQWERTYAGLDQELKTMYPDDDSLPG